MTVPSNGRIHYSNAQLIGSVATYTCNTSAGYVLPENNTIARRTCTQSGWTGNGSACRNTDTTSTPTTVISDPISTPTTVISDPTSTPTTVIIDPIDITVTVYSDPDSTGSTCPSQDTINEVHRRARDRILGGN